MSNNLSPLRVSQSYPDHEGNQVVEFSSQITEEDHKSKELSLMVSEEDGESVELSPPESLNDEKTKEFIKDVLNGNWEKVTTNYNINRNYHTIKMKGRGTALHVAVMGGLDAETVKSLLDAIETDDEKLKSLKTKNERGATPLHLAAYRGFTDVCEIIIGEKGKRRELIKEKDDDGQTPLYWAVCAHKTLVFLYLQQFYTHDENIAIDKNKISILHLTIQRDMFDLAIIIMDLYKGLVDIEDKDGNAPLQILATRTSAFETASSLPWLKKFLYCCVPRRHNHENIITDFLRSKAKDKENGKGNGRHSQENLGHFRTVSDLHEYYPITNFSTKKELLGQKPKRNFDPLGLKEIRTIKTNHYYGDLLFKDFMKKHVDPYAIHMALNSPEDRQKRGDTTIPETNENKHIEDSKNIDGKDTSFSEIVRSGFKDLMEELNSKVPTTSDKKGLLLVAMNYIKTDVNRDVADQAFLIAASYGIIVMMEGIHKHIRSSIYLTNSNRQNALSLAVVNRQPHVIQWMTIHHGEKFGHLVLQLDENENTILHLAAYNSSQRENAWNISGVALQMMWDIKWYQYIKGLAPEYFSDSINKERQTPSEIFRDNHKELLQNSASWMKDTAESCSVVAALIAGVSFATSGSLPGGNQQSGEPTFEGQPAFKGFALSSLIGLYFSVTSLIMFLAILTSRKEIVDFRIKLPLKLLLGLSSLFVSIVSMFVSFCAGHFFVLTDKYAKVDILFYLYISISVPVVFYAAVQLPLFVDLVKVIFFKVPPRSIKGLIL